jgi:membrane fusion protein, multidrug efflux system
MPDDSGTPPAPREGQQESYDPRAPTTFAEPAVGAHDVGAHEIPPPPRRLRLFGLVALIAALAAAAYGILARRASDQNLAAWTDQQAVPTVAVAHPLTDAAQRTLILPGDVQAFYDAPIYARVNGYLQSWTRDIGAHVQAGEVLGTIDTPDLDQELAQAQADLTSAQANATLAELTAKRWHTLLSSNSVSMQAADEKQGNAAATRALVAAAQAHVDRLRALQAFKRLTAPFEGVVTARNTDVGALINAGASATQPLFKVADIHEMRVYVRVPQVYASELTVGMKATLTQPQYPGQTFPARLATTSNAVSAESRTVLAELQADNKAGKLWPGTYAHVRFDLPPDQGVLRVPASALIFRAQGAELATLGPQDRIDMKPVSVGRNLGNEIEITSGIKPSDLVVSTPLDTLENGEAVQVAAPAAVGEPAGAPD